MVAVVSMSGVLARILHVAVGLEASGGGRAQRKLETGELVWRCRVPTLTSNSAWHLLVSSKGLVPFPFQTTGSTRYMDDVLYVVHTCTEYGVLLCSPDWTRAWTIQILPGEVDGREPSSSVTKRERESRVAK